MKLTEIAQASALRDSLANIRRMQDALRGGTTQLRVTVVGENLPAELLADVRQVVLTGLTKVQSTIADQLTALGVTDVTKAS